MRWDKCRTVSNVERYRRVMRTRERDLWMVLLKSSSAQWTHSLTRSTFTLRIYRLTDDEERLVTDAPTVVGVSNKGDWLGLSGQINRSSVRLECTVSSLCICDSIKWSWGGGEGSWNSARQRVLWENCLSLWSSDGGIVFRTQSSVEYGLKFE